MEQWKETGAKTGTPSDDVPLNLENGTRPLPSLIQLN